MDKKTTLAIVLTAVVWLGWFLWTQNMKTTEIPPASKQEVLDNKAQDKPEVQTSSTAQVSLPPASALLKESVVEAATDRYKFEFTTKGAAIKKAVYLDKNIELVVAGNPYMARNLIDFSLHFNDDEFINGNMLDSAVWDYVREKDGIRFFTSINYNGQPLVIEKIFAFKKDAYSFDVSYRIKNTGKGNASLQNGTVVFSPGDMLGPSVNFYNRYNTTLRNVLPR